MDQLPIMTKSAESHHQKPRSITKSSASFRVTVCCDGSRSAAIDVFILIALIITFGFLIIPFSKFITVKALVDETVAHRPRPPSHHLPLLIRFSDSTEFEETTEPFLPIPEERFRFRNHSELLGLANPNTHFPVVEDMIWFKCWWMSS
ncbi:hypothetical protein DY000_02049058 [Brassica cretica]|uniref:Uncharacterized protein n=1 Tax=Brassica cretica TaxID=69181 RepID=A0ABQ7F1J7_BRACR|nr:hypothetical protein DY000_02049058 [Brassica cretica]